MLFWRLEHLRDRKSNTVIVFSVAQGTSVWDGLKTASL